MKKSKQYFSTNLGYVFEVIDDEELLSHLYIRGLESLENFDLENPAKQFAVLMKNGGFDDMSDDEITLRVEVANVLSELWNGKPEISFSEFMMNIYKMAEENQNLKKEEHLFAEMDAMLDEIENEANESIREFQRLSDENK